MKNCKRFRAPPRQPGRPTAKGPGQEERGFFWGGGGGGSPREGSQGGFQWGSQGAKHFSAPPHRPTIGSPHGIGLQLLQAKGGGSHGGGASPKMAGGEGWVRGGRRPDPCLLVPNASRQKAEANMNNNMNIRM